MKKIICIIALCITTFYSHQSHAQYKLNIAFPNLQTFDNPIELVHAYDGTNRMFVVQQRGLIYVFNNDPSVSTAKLFINLSGKVSQSGNEKGLLGLAFHPDYENNRQFFVNYTFDSVLQTWSRISRFTSSLSNPDTAVTSTEEILLTLFQPFTNHNGGKVAFGPDGYFYISFGDGGSGGDPNGNGQSRNTLLGKILRINVDSAGGGKAYSIPATNPYHGNMSGYREEIFAYGLRNVWKFSFDDLTGQIWAGDVGQSAFEEVDIIESGKNYGWNKMEGFACYGTCDTTGKGFTRPVWDYPRSVGTSITGGYVYRGSKQPDLYGKYIYADYPSGKVFSIAYNGVTATNTLLFDTTYLISSLGTDQNNEMYFLRLSSTARIYKLYKPTVINLKITAAIQGFLDVNTNTMSMSDTVKVYLHQISSPYAAVDSFVTVLNSSTLSGYCNFSNAPNGNYYVNVEHRNGLETWSKLGGMTLSRGSDFQYDFTSASSQAYGNNEILVGSKYTIYSGDVNRDGSVDISDNGIIENDAAIFLTGYIVTDLNGDGLTDLSDQTLADNNSFNFVTKSTP
ncbi:MAG: PQQ-dependent sugar dehydrogenase [Ignavibacteria bacterium]|nr:PQQ-dependent sugar dehydrogenase [Ignavibacteria bacterium]